MISYLNQVTQTLNVCADIVGRENQAAAALLRTIAASKAVAADRFMKLMARGQKNQETGNRFGLTKRIDIPRCALSDDTFDEMFPVIQSVIQTETALSAFPDTGYVYAWITEKHEVNEIKDGARTAVQLLERVLWMLTDGDRGPYYCTNCLSTHNEREECSCGVGKAFLATL